MRSTTSFNLSYDLSVLPMQALKHYGLVQYTAKATIRESSLFIVSGKDVLDPPRNISVSFTPDETTFHGHLSWNLAPRSEQIYVIIWTNLYLRQFFMQAYNQKRHGQPLTQLHTQLYNCTH